MNQQLRTETPFPCQWRWQWQWIVRPARRIGNLGMGQIPGYIPVQAAVSSPRLPSGSSLASSPVDLLLALRLSFSSGLCR
ncbi:hypothetical protein BDW69DRAFT_44164 [Aspergillus filifer]